MPQQRGYLENVYKILLLKSVNIDKDFLAQQEEKSDTLNFHNLLKSIFENEGDQETPDFVIRNRSSETKIYLDRATKLDIILSTVRKVSSNLPEEEKPPISEPEHTMEQ